VSDKLDINRSGGEPLIDSLSNQALAEMPDIINLMEELSI
jgi:hypothetical protein